LYVLPYGQMSLWGATVITNMLSAVPWIGQDFVQFVWGGFSVNNATLNRFFSLHYLLPFLLSALAIMHMMALHVHGSSNPLGISSNADKLAMHPYFIFKDLVTILAFFLALSIIIFYQLSRQCKHLRQLCQNGTYYLTTQFFDQFLTNC